MTPKRKRGKGDLAYIPDKRLILEYASKYGWKPTKLTAVLVCFGLLSREGQVQLIRCLVLAFGRYQFSAKTIERVTPGEQRKQLKAIEKTAKRLLQQLGETGVEICLATAGVVTAGKDQVAINAELRKANVSIGVGMGPLIGIQKGPL